MLSTAASLALTSIVDHLIQSGHEIELADHIGTTALTRAAQDGHTDTVKILSTAGAEIYRREADGITALIVTAANSTKRQLLFFFRIIQTLKLEQYMEKLLSIVLCFRDISPEWSYSCERVQT